MISQRHITVWTLNRFAARATQDKARIPTTVQEDYRLLATCVSRLNRVYKFTRKHLRLSLLGKHLTHVDDACRSHRSRANALRELKILVLAIARVLKRLQRRSRRPKDHRC